MRTWGEVSGDGGGFGGGRTRGRQGWAGASGDAAGGGLRRAWLRDWVGCPGLLSGVREESDGGRATYVRMPVRME